MNAAWRTFSVGVVVVRSCRVRHPDADGMDRAGSRAPPRVGWYDERLRSGPSEGAEPGVGGVVGGRADQHPEGDRHHRDQRVDDRLGAQLVVDAEQLGHADETCGAGHEEPEPGKEGDELRWPVPHGLHPERQRRHRQGAEEPAEQPAEHGGTGHLAGVRGEHDDQHPRQRARRRRQVQVVADGEHDDAEPGRPPSETVDRVVGEHGSRQLEQGAGGEDAEGEEEQLHEAADEPAGARHHLPGRQLDGGDGQRRARQERHQRWDEDAHRVVDLHVLQRGEHDDRDDERDDDREHEVERRQSRQLRQPDQQAEDEGGSDRADGRLQEEGEADRHHGMAERPNRPAERRRHAVDRVRAARAPRRARSTPTTQRVRACTARRPGRSAAAFRAGCRSRSGWPFRVRSRPSATSEARRPRRARRRTRR